MTLMQSRFSIIAHHILGAIFIVSGLEVANASCSCEEIAANRTKVSVIEIETSCLNGAFSSQLGIYASNKDWYETFHAGSFFIEGWRAKSEKILDSINSSELKEQVAVDLCKMGVVIGLEWSKDNSIRKIDNDDLENWGEKLQMGLDAGDNELVAEISLIGQEVDPVTETGFYAYFYQK
jgi:hypothetical protein